MHLILCVFITLLHVSVKSSSVSNSHSHEWDLLIFTQHWPITVCLEWKEVVPTHTCILPSTDNEWTIHGIWPTKLGTIGPAFCNSSWHFNPKEIEPIEDKLEQYWTNVHTGSRYDLWHHEWDKHGTCAASVPELASEINYFSRGLTWINQYNMNKILENAKILPDVSDYDAEDLFMAVRNNLGVHPDIQCLKDHRVDPREVEGEGQDTKTMIYADIVEWGDSAEEVQKKMDKWNEKTGDVYLFEIRICFTKALVLTDCDGVKFISNNKTVITNCPPGKVIIYPTKVPPADQIKQPRMPWLLDVLYFLKWLQWLTL